MTEAEPFRAVIRCHDDLIEAFWAIKERVGISNLALDARIGVAAGYTDRVIGPARSKNMSPALFDDLLAMFALQLEVTVDLAAAELASRRWEPRDSTQIRWNGRVSQRVLDRAKPHVLRDFSSAGNAARNRMLPAEQRNKIARKAANVRWRKYRREIRQKRRQQETRV